MSIILPNCSRHDVYKIYILNNSLLFIFFYKWKPSYQRNNIWVKHLIKITTLYAFPRFSFSLPMCRSIQMYINIYNSRNSFWQFIPLIIQPVWTFIKGKWELAICTHRCSDLLVNGSQPENTQGQFNPDFQTGNKDGNKVSILHFLHLLVCYQTENIPNSRPSVVLMDIVLRK